MVTSTKARRSTTFYAGASYVAGDSVGYLLNQVVISMRRQIEQAMTAHDLTAAQWYPLWKLQRDGSCTAQELARETAAAGLDLPLFEAAATDYRQAVAAGLANAEYTAVSRVLEERNGRPLFGVAGATGRPA